MAQTAFKQVADNAISSTTTNLSSIGVTSITLASGDGAKFPQPGNGYWLTLWDNTKYPNNPGADPNMEKVTCTARSTDALTISATTKTHPASGCAVALLDVSQNITDLQVAVNAIEANYVHSSSLATVATTGSYNDLLNKPTIPAAQVNSDWNAVSGIAQILNKPVLATVATTGAYADLSGKPTLGTLASLNSIDLTANVGSTVLPIANGGTGSATQNFVDLTTNQTIAGNKTYSGLHEFDSTSYTYTNPAFRFLQVDSSATDDHAKGLLLEWGGNMTAGVNYPYGIATQAYAANPAATFTVPTTGYKKWGWMMVHYQSPSSTGETVHQHLNLETVKSDWATVVTRLQISFGEDTALVSFPNSNVKVFNDLNFQIGTDTAGLFIKHNTSAARVDATSTSPLSFNNKLKLGATSSPGADLDVETSIDENMLRLLQKLNSANGSAQLLIQGTTAGGIGIQMGLSGESVNRWSTNTSGKMEWGSGSATRDTNLYRASAGNLKTDYKFTAALGLDSGSNKITNVASGATSTDAANYGQISSALLALAPTGATGETFSRIYTYGVAYPTLTSGTLYVRAIYLPAGVTVNDISFFVGNTPEAGGTHGWYCLLDSNLVVRAVTADQTGSTTWGSTFGVKTLAVSAPYTTPSAGLYYVGFCIAATTMPTFLCGAGSLTNLMGLSPVLMATSSTGQTTPPTTGTTVGALTANATWDFYAYTS